MGGVKLTRKQKRQLISLFLAILLLFSTWIAQQFGWIDTVKDTAVQIQPGQYRVVSFEDGDTITVDMNGVNERVRFIGVDTPETQDPRYPVQCYGKAASNFTRNLIGDNPVRLEADPTNTNRDRYNRLLRYVYLPDGTLVNAEVIKQGYGFAYVLFPFEKLEEFRNYEQEARDNNRGLWNTCEINQDGEKKTTSPA